MQDTLWGLPQWGQLLARPHHCRSWAWAGVRGARRFLITQPLCLAGGKGVLHHLFHCFRPQGVTLASLWFLSTYVRSSFSRAKATGPSATLNRGYELVAFLQLWKFRSPVVLQHFVIIPASILRIPSPRNVGGLSFYSLLVLSLYLQTQFLSASARWGTFFPPSCIIAANCQEVDGFSEVKADQSHTCFLNAGSIYSFRLLQWIFAYRYVSSNAKVSRTEMLFLSHLFPRASEWCSGRHHSECSWHSSSSSWSQWHSCRDNGLLFTGGGSKGPSRLLLFLRL